MTVNILLLVISVFSAPYNCWYKKIEQRTEIEQRRPKIIFDIIKIAIDI